MHLILIISIFTRAIQSVSQLHGQTSRGSTATLQQTIFAWKFSRMAFGLLIYNRTHMDVSDSSMCTYVWRM